MTTTGKIEIPVMRKTVPTIIAQDIIGVQPMRGQMPNMGIIPHYECYRLKGPWPKKCKDTGKRIMPYEWHYKLKYGEWDERGEWVSDSFRICAEAYTMRVLQGDPRVQNVETKHNPWWKI